MFLFDAFKLLPFDSDTAKFSSEREFRVVHLLRFSFCLSFFDKLPEPILNPPQEEVAEPTSLELVL